MPVTIDEQLAFLRKGTVEIIREDDLRAKLERGARTRVDYEVDLPNGGKILAQVGKRRFLELEVV